MDMANLALRFVVCCLNRPSSVIADDQKAIVVQPEVNLGPPGYLDYATFPFTDAHMVLQAVSHWCGLHGLHMRLEFSDGNFICAITRLGIDTFEAYPCPDACEVMLLAAVEIDQNIRLSGDG